MDITEAKKTIRIFSGKSVLSDDEEFMLLEALEYMIKETGETHWMTELGGYHYEKKNFDLALKYYEMADEFGDKWAPEGLGYIWYYGRTGKKDYKKAFDYYSRAAANGRLQSKVKVADMYKNGYGVPKDMDKYRQTIEEAYEIVEDSDYLGDPLPEIYTRLAKIRTEQGDIDAAVDLYEDAKYFLAQRLVYNQFFGNLNIMKWLTEDLYELIDFDRADFDLYDLYVLLNEPVKVSFKLDEEEYIVESVQDDDGISIKFGDKWYRSIDDFFAKATIDGELLPANYYHYYGFKVV